MNIASWLHQNGQLHGDLPAISRGQVVHKTHRQWAHESRRRAATLARRFQPGARIAIAMDNTPAFFEALFAIWHAGLIAVPMNAKLHRNEFEYILQNSEAVLTVADGKLAEVCNGLSEILEINSAEWRATTGEAEIDVAAAAPDDPAWLFYTSGTTGRPKGATLTHRNLLMMSLAYFADIEPVSPGHAMIHPAPLSHGAGLYSLPFVLKGANNVVPESGGFSAAEVAELLRAYSGVSFFAAPTIVRRLMAAAEFDEGAKAGLRTLIYGGAPMHVADLRAAIGKVGDRLAQIYGQGESPMTITALAKEDHVDRADPRWAERLSSAGTARTGVEVAIVDEDDRPVPLGETGEVVCRGDVVMAGYWRDPAATADGLRNGWLHTGDVGEMNADGYLFLKDRSKDVIISGGSNIYSREVEDVLLKHAGVKEVAVIGAPHADWGEEVVAFVVVDPAGPSIIPELDALCLASIARFKRPRRYLLLDELPRNNYGKVLKTALRGLAQEGGAERPAAPLKVKSGRRP